MSGVFYYNHLMFSSRQTPITNGTKNLNISTAERESLQFRHAPFKYPEKISDGYHCRLMLWAFQLLWSRIYIQHHYFNISLLYHYPLIFPILTSPTNTHISLTRCFATVATVSIFSLNLVKGEASSQIRWFSHHKGTVVFLFIASTLPQARNTQGIFETINTSCTVQIEKLQ